MSFDSLLIAYLCYLNGIVLENEMVIFSTSHGPPDIPALWHREMATGLGKVGSSQFLNYMNLQQMTVPLWVLISSSEKRIMPSLSAFQGKDGNDS